MSPIMVVRNDVVGISRKDKEEALRKTLGTALFFLYCFYFFLHFTGVVSPRAIETPVLILSMIYFFVYGGRYRFSIPVIFGFFFLFFTLVSWYFVSLDYPEYDHDLLSVRRVLGFLSFIPLAYLIGGDRGRAVILLSSFALGFALSPWLGGHGLENFQNGFAGERVRFGTNPILDGIMAAVLMMFAFFALVRFFSLSKRGIVFLIAFLISALYFLSIIYVTQSRSAYVAAVVTVVFMLIFYFLSHPSFFMTPKGAFCISFAFFTLIAVYFFAASSGVIERSSHELSSLLSLVGFDWSSAPDTSWGYRLQMLSLGVEYSLQRPFLGWGNSGGYLIMDLSGFHAEKNTFFPHLHNNYVEFLVRYGYFFLLCFFCFLGYIFLSLFKIVFVSESFDWLAYSVFAACFFVFVASNFDAVIIHSDTSRLFSILISIALSLVWFHKK